MWGGNLAGTMTGDTRFSNQNYKFASSGTAHHVHRPIGSRVEPGTSASGTLARAKFAHLAMSGSIEHREDEIAHSLTRQRPHDALLRPGLLLAVERAVLTRLQLAIA